ncbi:MAG: hypothetical protein KBE91_01745 [Bacteroidia bacterium]|nr:hypothetical protein [Bacteroidia bacterium]MBP9688304.1 hypothetical protein [Bacteroidia bacterium]
MYQHKKVYLLIVLIICLTAFVAGDGATIKLTDQLNKPIIFKIKSQRIEWVNNSVNLAFLSTDNKLIQINNIPEKALVDTTIKTSRVHILMIDSNCTYKQNRRNISKVEIKCAGPASGNQLSILVKGRFYHKKRWYDFDIKSQQILPKEKTIGTSTRIMN